MKKTISFGMIWAASSAMMLGLTWTAMASAQPKIAPKATSTAATGDYGYTFTDDDVRGGGMAASDSVIHAGRFIKREGLIRPRTSFVQDMLKSVENL